MAIRYLNKPFFLATLICLLVFYSGLFNIPERSRLSTLLKTENITFVSGIMLSTPVKGSSGKYYSGKFQIESAQDNNNFISSGKGIIKIYIPVTLVEAFFPGKLYSPASDKGAFIYEAGGIYCFEGNFKNNDFYISKCNYNIWNRDFYGKVDYFRALCRLQFKRLMYSWGKAGGLLLALLSGSREYTDEVISESFRNAGLSHILALSGMHLSMFSSIAIFFGNRLGRKKQTYILRIVISIFFVWFAGFSPSLLRAFICSVLSLIATMNGTKDPDMILIICFSFLLQSIISPDDIYNIGFMLSYGALTGILLTSRFINRYLSKIFPKPLSASLSASTGAQIFTAPISLKSFGTFCPVGIFSTAIVSPLVTIYIYSGLLLIMLSLIFPVLQRPSGIFVNLQYTVIKFIVMLFSHAPKWSLS